MSMSVEELMDLVESVQIKKKRAKKASAKKGTMSADEKERKRILADGRRLRLANYMGLIRASGPKGEYKLVTTDNNGSFQLK